MRNLLFVFTLSSFCPYLMANGFSRTPFIHLNIECHINKTSVNKGDTLEIKFIAFDRRPISDTSMVIGFIQLPLGVELITITSQTPYRGLGNSQFSWNVTRNKPNNIADEIVFTCKVTESQNFRDYVSSLGYFYRIEFLRVKSDNYYQPYGYNLNDSTNCSFFIPPPPPPPCDTCMYEFSPKVGKYFISGWCTSSNLSNLNQQSSAPKIVVSFSGTSFLNIFYPTGSIIDNWKKIEGEFTIPNGAGVMHIELLCETGTCYFDDIRFHPLDGSMKSYTYDPITFRLSAELDERNYATFYEYDEEGKLTRIKKETEKGIMTIQEKQRSFRKMIYKGFTTLFIFLVCITMCSAQWVKSDLTVLAQKISNFQNNLKVLPAHNKFYGYKLCYQTFVNQIDNEPISTKIQEVKFDEYGNYNFCDELIFGVQNETVLLLIDSITRQIFIHKADGTIYNDFTDLTTMKNQTESILSKKDKKLETYSLLLKQGGQLKGAEYHFDNASKLDSILIYFAQEINLGNEYEPLMGVPKYKIVFERKREISKNDFLIVEQVIKIDESGKFSLNEKYKNYQLTDAR